MEKSPVEDETYPKQETRLDGTPKEDSTALIKEKEVAVEAATAEEQPVVKNAGAPAGAQAGVGEEEDDDYHNSTSSALSEERWDEMFGRLLEFKEIHGHCLVPNRYKEDLQLGAWVSGQRKNQRLLKNGSGKSTPMTKERAQRLMDVGFEWTAKNPRHLMWEVRYAELRDFKNQFGHAQVPIGWEQNVQLANWVSTQRQEYKNLIKGKTSRLNDGRVSMLSGLGFAWELQRGGRRRRLTVASHDRKGGKSPRPPHPADNDDDDLERPAKKMKFESTDDFAIDDGSSPVRSSATGRKRTTLKKKLTPADGSSKCILPGVAIMGGGRDATAPSRPNKSQQRRGRGGNANTTGGAARAGEAPMMSGGNPLQQQQAAMANFQNNEAFIRALGSGGAAPWQVLPNGAYQFANPLSHHLTGGGAGNPFFPMAAAAPFGMMNPFGHPQQLSEQGMNPQEIEFRRRQQVAAFAAAGGGMQGGPFQVPSMAGNAGEHKSSEDGQHQQAARQQSGMHPHPFSGGAAGAAGFPPGMGTPQQGGAPFWGGMNENTAAAAAAAHHLQAAAALTAGMDERSLPPHLASVASAARRMNTNMTGGGAPAGDMNGMAGSGGRRGDPPEDPPTGNLLQGASGSPESAMRQRRDNANVGPGMKTNPGVFADADE